MTDEIHKFKNELDNDEIQTLRDELDLKPKEILISPVTNKYAWYHKAIVISGYYRDYDTYFDFNMFFIPNHAFHFFCIAGFFDWAKELLHLGDVSLEHCHELCFEDVCYIWYLKDVQWLYSLRCVSPDILEEQIYEYVCYNHRVMTESSYNECWDLVKWLWFLLSKNRQNSILKSLRYNDYRDIAKCLKSLNKPLVIEANS